MNFAPRSPSTAAAYRSLLLVTDDKQTAEHLNIFLNDLRHSVHYAGTVKEAYAAIREIQPDIVIIDHKSSEMDNPDLLRLIRKEKAATEFIIVIDQSRSEDLITDLEPYDVEFIAKPLTPAMLSLTLKRIDEKKRLKEQVRELEARLTLATENQSASMAVLEQAQDKYKHLFNQVPCYITVQDRNMRIVEANDRFLNDFGFERGNLCHQAYKNRDTECEDCPVRKTFVDGGSHHSETVVTTKTGEQYNILVWTAPVFDESGRVEHVLEVSTNITMVRQLQDQLTSLGMMLGSMSHGIKGLLGALDGGIYLVDSGLKKQDCERVHKGWKVVKHRIGHMRKMVLDTLYYAKSRDLECRPVSLGDFADDLAATVEGKALDHGINLVKDFSHPETIFQADPVALAPAIVNFLENGIDACLYDRSKAEHTVTFRVFERNKHVHFEVSDNGTGMDPETSENMFSLFFSSKGANGTGIGLFISNQVIERHGGTITVESELEKGTRFIIRLPISRSRGCREAQRLFD